MADGFVPDPVTPEPKMATQRKREERQHDRLCITITIVPNQVYCWCMCPKCWDPGKRKCICYSCGCDSLVRSTRPVRVSN